MTALLLKTARQRVGHTQAWAAERLGVSQAYLSLLEKGHRKVPENLSRKAMRVFNLSPTALPLPSDNFDPEEFRGPQQIVRQLSALNYPGFRYLHASRVKHPAVLLLAALTKSELESRLTEALPWLLLEYSDLNEKWLVEQACRFRVQNRLGFVAGLALKVCEGKRETSTARYQNLKNLVDQLAKCKMEREDTLCNESLSENERRWLREQQPDEAREWHLLTDWRPQDLQYAT